MVPGMRSARWLVTTKAIWPWVSTAALERPVVPEVKKNQQGSSYSTAGIIDIGACMGSDRLAHGFLAERALAHPPSEGERRARGFRGGGMVGKIAVAKERLRAGGGGEIGDLVRHQAEIGRHPDRAEPERRKHRPEHLVAILGMHQDAVALGDAARRQVPPPAPRRGDRSRARSRIARPRSKPTRSPCRRAFWVSKMREVHHPARHPRHAAQRGGVTGFGSRSPSSHPDARPKQHHTDHAGDDAVLVMHPRHAGLMAREKARQLIRRHQEINRGNDEQDDAEQGQQSFMRLPLMNRRVGRAMERSPSYRNLAACRKGGRCIGAGRQGRRRARMRSRCHRSQCVPALRGAIQACATCKISSGATGRSGLCCLGNLGNRMSDVIDNRAHHRYELAVDGHLAATYYKIADGVITFIHTEVPPELGGKGIGSKLIRARSTRCGPTA